MGGQAAGPLLIGASMTIGEYVLPQLIGKFKARFPAVMPTLFVGNSEAVQERVAERTLDLGFIEGDSHLSSLQSEVVLRGRAAGGVRAVAPAGARSRSRRPRRSPSIPTSAASRARARAKSSIATCRRPASRRRSMNRVVELGSPEALKGLVATGLGFAIMSRVIVAKELQLGQLVQVPLQPGCCAISRWCTRRSASTPSWSPASSPLRRSSSPAPSASPPR